MKEVTPLISAAFSIAGDVFNLDEITERLSIQPSTTRTKDEWPKSTVFTFSDNENESPELLIPRTEWVLKTKRTESYGVSSEIEKLLVLLKNKESIINELCAEYDLWTTFCAYVHMEGENNPELYLSKDVVRFMAAVNAEFGIDLYVYCDGSMNCGFD